MRIRKLMLAVLVFAASLLAVGVVYAQQETPNTPTDNEVNEIAKKLYCPVCPNTPLDVCETQACQDWRALIKQQLAEGWTEEEILNYFVVQYGERVLAEPQRRGFTSLVWVLPVTAAALGAVVVWQVVKSWQAARLPVQNDLMEIPDIDPEVRARVEQELRALEEEL